MLFPIIKVKDKQTNSFHIVGANVHDQLKINDGQSISYHNLQNGEGTGQNGDYHFLGNYCEFEGMTVEFVTFEELQEIYSEHCSEKEESQKLLQELLSGFLK